MLLSPTLPLHIAIGGNHQAALRREGALEFRFADYAIDLGRHELRRSGEVISIEPQVFDLLVHLLRHRDRTVSKDELFKTVWEGRIVSDAALSSRIKSARKAIGDNGDDQVFIRTLHKRGFRFVGEVEEVAARDAAPVAPISEVGEGERPHDGMAFVGSPGITPRDAEVSAPPSGAKPSIAVLPFAAMRRTRISATA
jgi:DNA-binding winged helix-turn-helix (wHTH) protein